MIEKFEKHSDVGYAFVLLTPDEVRYHGLAKNTAQLFTFFMLFNLWMV
jgi:IS5 family transposase